MKIGGDIKWWGSLRRTTEDLQGLGHHKLVRARQHPLQEIIKKWPCF